MKKILTLVLVALFSVGFVGSNQAAAYDCSSKEGHHHADKAGHDHGHMHDHGGAHDHEHKMKKEKSCCGSCGDCAEAKAYYDKKKKMSKKYKKPSTQTEIIDGRIMRPANNWNSGSRANSYND